MLIPVRAEFERTVCRVRHKNDPGKSRQGFAYQQPVGLATEKAAAKQSAKVTPFADGNAAAVRKKGRKPPLLQLKFGQMN